MTLVLIALLAASPALTTQLAGLERQLYEDWKAKRLDAFERNLADDAVALGEYGAFDKSTQLRFQKGASNCDVKDFTLSEIEVKDIAPDVELLIYRVDQNAECGVTSVPTPLRNATLYVKRKGQWKVVVRTSNPLKKLPE